MRPREIGHQTRFYYTKTSALVSSFPVWYSGKREGVERREWSKVVSSNQATDRGKKKNLPVMLESGDKVSRFDC